MTTHTRAEGGESRVSDSQHQRHNVMVALTQRVATDVHTVHMVQTVDKIGQEDVHGAVLAQRDRPYDNAHRRSRPQAAASAGCSCGALNRHSKQPASQYRPCHGKSGLG